MNDAEVLPGFTSIKIDMGWPWVPSHKWDLIHEREVVFTILVIRRTKKQWIRPENFQRGDAICDKFGARLRPGYTSTKY